MFVENITLRDSVEILAAARERLAPGAPWLFVIQRRGMGATGGVVLLRLEFLMTNLHLAKFAAQSSADTCMRATSKDRGADHAGLGCVLAVFAREGVPLKMA